MRFERPRRPDFERLPGVARGLRMMRQARSRLGGTNVGEGSPGESALAGEPAYEPRQVSRSEFAVLPGVRYHVRLWGDPRHRPLVMVHGGRDASATFQFLVDALARNWFVVAPDLRGHGLTDRFPGYAFADYLADLDAVLGHVFPGQAVPLLGHSLGGNIVSVYAGIRPGRVSHVISLDGFGLPDRDPSEAPGHLARWLDACADPPTTRVYPKLADLAERLLQANPRLDRQRAFFLAQHAGRAVKGGVVWAYDPMHRLPFAALHRTPEWAACIARTRAPMLWIGSDRPFPPALEREPGGLQQRVTLAGATFRRIPGAGHNLHHDAPDTVAALIEPFLTQGPAEGSAEELG